MSFCRRLYLLMFSLVSLIVLGAFSPPLYSQEEGEVMIDGTVIIRFSGGRDAGAKAKAVTGRIEEKIQAGSPVRELKVKPVPGGAAIMWGTTLICVVDATQAKAHNTSPLLLARRWVANITALLGENPLRLSRDSLTLPVGED